MRNFFDTYNIVVGAVIALFTTIFGAYWYIFAAYMVLNIFDWLTGWYKSRRARQESSAVGLKGIVKKLGYCFCEIRTRCSTCRPCFFEYDRLVYTSVPNG